ncbi:MAG: DNA-processing protein DprA [Gemmatimonadaceae bacterium]
MSSESRRSSSPDERRAILALTLVANVGSVTHKQLIARFGSASRALNEAIPPAVATVARADAVAMLADSEKSGLTLIAIGDEAYPEQLTQLYDPPPVVWSRGDSGIGSLETLVAVVGTRRATSYGLRVTHEIVGALARAGATIVSGMALGIDAAAHRAALDANARTIAVLGTGADVAYPRAHTSLHREIAAKGLILSELPPGARSDAGSFPRRNRIIAGLASLTIVIEAPLKSGALITSRCALDLGRDVAAVPGPIDSPQSVGSNELIRDGAHAITSIADALCLVGLDAPVKLRPVITVPAEICVFDALSRSAASLDELCTRSGLPVAECLAAVTALEVRGIIECPLTGEVRRR